MANPYEAGDWVPCLDCEGWFCLIHEQHAAECPCPPIDPD
jgi:hypothetical protein